jgi:hypothetical protein
VHYEGGGSQRCIMRVVNIKYESNVKLGKEKGKREIIKINGK